MARNSLTIKNLSTIKTILPDRRQEVYLEEVVVLLTDPEEVKQGRSQLVIVIILIMVVVVVVIIIMIVISIMTVISIF